jgi:hypothetical protein
MSNHGTGVGRSGGCWVAALGLVRSVFFFFCLGKSMFLVFGFRVFGRERERSSVVGEEKLSSLTFAR